LSNGFSRDQWREIEKRDKTLNPIPACVDYERWSQRISQQIDREFIQRYNAKKNEQRVWEDGWPGRGPSMNLED